MLTQLDDVRRSGKGYEEREHSPPQASVEASRGTSANSQHETDWDGDPFDPTTLRGALAEVHRPF